MLSYFRMFGFVEALSLLVLLFVAMPLKHIYGKPEMVKIVGMTHGMLFVGYVLFAYIVSQEYKWKFSKFIFTCVIASIPFGPFVLDKMIFGESSEQV